MMPGITPFFPGPEDEVTQMLRGALHAEASGVNPPDRFADLLASLDAEEDELPRGRRTFRWVAAAGVAAIALAVSVPLILQDRVEPAVSATPSVAAPTTTTTSRSPTSNVPLPGPLESLPIYYVGRDGLLYREFRSLVGEDSLTTAVNALLNVEPLDPDYASRWAPGNVLAVRDEGTQITIDLSESAFATFTDATLAREAIDQLVYTVTGVVGDPDGVRSVVVLAAGRAELPVLGAPDAPFARSGVNPLGFVWVNSPQHGAELAAGAVRVTGDVRSGLGPVSVEVRDAAGSLVSEQAATPSNDGGSWEAWEASVALEPGTWTVVVVADGYAESKVVVVS
ncbi:MAG TPA: Gmad2 immunoglobulin-like domain-containing protein [Propionibacteriaceae bacterium]|nr:Gmad2 immunoglobulin-like domain-containing protein [Propionibacteriaceae bacterium]